MLSQDPSIAASTPLIAGLVAGVPVSLHCAGMCGPLAGCFLGGRGVLWRYHAARLLAYAAAGALLGGVGQALGLGSLTGGSPALSFVLAGLLVLFAFGLERRLGKLPGLARVSGAAMRASAGLTPGGRAIAIGALTPLLPCGVLYGAYVFALGTGSTAEGALFMAAFGAGSLPLLLGAQLGLGRLHARLGPIGMRRLQGAAMLAAAAILVWRGLAVAGGGSCCH
ncbi:MAG: sulfite exporter TauE/SafE family protein [Planctomycetota bacterium]